MMKKLIVIAILFSSVCVQVQQKTSLFVSPKGNDKNAGTIKAPLRSLEAARLKVRQLKKKNTNSEIRVNLREGTYYLDSTWVLRPEDSGNEGAPVVYTAYANEKPIIDGSTHILGWEKSTSSDDALHPSVRGKVWVARIPKGQLFHYLYVNHQMRRRAQSDHRYWRHWRKDHVAGKPDASGQLIRLSDNDQLKYLPSNGDAEMVCIMFQYGVMGNGVIRDVDTVAKTLRWNSRQTNIITSRNNAERGYIFENVPHFIDTPGDWAVNSERGLVYYYPMDGENMNTINVVAPRLYELVRLYGNEAEGKIVKNIVLDGITFRYTDRLPEDQWPYQWLMRQWENVDAAIYMSGAENCTLKNNTILYSGSYGVTLNHYAQHIVLQRNEIGFTGSGGLFLEGYGPGTKDVNRNNIIEANYIHDHGLGNYWHSPSIQNYQSGHNTIRYNLLQRSAYSGISTVGLHPKYMTDLKIAKPGHFEGQVQSWNLGQMRFNDLPENIQAGLENGTYRFDRETIKPYLHSNKNIIEYNIISEPHSLLYEGGAIYAWCLGKDNVWKDNVIFKSMAMHGSSVLALDDIAEYTTIEGNVVWVEGNVLDVVGARGDERGNKIRKNYRVNYKEEYSSVREKDKIGIWWVNDKGRTPLDALLNKIQTAVKARGGWLGNPSVGVPAPGEKITKYGHSEALPQGSNVTIE